MNWKTIFKSFKNRDMQKRLLIVLGLVVVYRFLAHVPVPLTSQAEAIAYGRGAASLLTSSEGTSAPVHELLRR